MVKVEEAWFVNADTGARVVKCRFAPNELTIAKSNQWQPQGKAGSHAPDLHFQSMGPRTLTLTLIFDTYEEGEKGTDVRKAGTDQLQSLMDVGGKQKQPSKG